MSLTALAPYAAMLITVVVWALIQRANRKHEIFKERLRKRVDMFDGLLPEIGRFIDPVNMQIAARNCSTSIINHQSSNLVATSRLHEYLGEIPYLISEQGCLPALGNGST